MFGSASVGPGLILLAAPLFCQAPVEPVSMSVKGDGAAGASRASAEAPGFRASPAQTSDGSFGPRGSRRLFMEKLQTCSECSKVPLDEPKQPVTAALRQPGIPDTQIFQTNHFLL